MVRSLRLPGDLLASIWAHVHRELPNECVGVLGVRVVPVGSPADGHAEAGGASVRAVYPLSNIADQPHRRYLADPASLLRALKAMRQDGLQLGAIYHSHPHGRARPSATDLQLAEYRVPYLIADVEEHRLQAYLLPENVEVEVQITGG